MRMVQENVANPFVGEEDDDEEIVKVPATSTGTTRKPSASTPKVKPIVKKSAAKEVLLPEVEDFSFGDLDPGVLESGVSFSDPSMENQEEAEDDFGPEEFFYDFSETGEGVSDESDSSDSDGSEARDDRYFIDDELDSVLTSLDREKNSPMFYEGEYSEDTEEDELSGFNIDEVLADAIDVGASDVHISAGDVIRFSILGEITRAPKYQIPTGIITQRLQLNIISHVLQDELNDNLELDTSYVIKTGRHRGRRLRLSIGQSFGDIFLVMRVISDTVPTPEELGVSKMLLSWTDMANGLIMMNGPTGTGKSTTLASLVKRIQLTRAQKIITLEKPIEFVFGNEGKALVTQREIGQDARTFSQALDSAMRQAPDIILVGEVRNKNEVDSLLRAAETGHLAISTMHTNSTAATLNRIKSLYDGDEQKRVLASLSDVSRGFANQVLLKSVDGKSRFAIREVLEVNREIADFIAQGDVKGIRDYQIRNEITMEHGLVEAVIQKRCTLEAALAQSAYPQLFNEILSKRTSKHR